MHRDGSTAERTVRLHWIAAACEVLLVFGVFFAHAGWPVPDPNEPHYLAKAKHFWQPDWIVGDAFLDSPDAHYVFYVACGWLTTVFSLSASAWIGRVATWLLAAVAWRRLASQLRLPWGFAALSAVGFLAASERWTMAGEWVIGGFESKGIAYALVFFGLGDLAAGRWERVWLWFGAASAFHPLVGGWSVLAAGVSWVMTGRRYAPLRKQLIPLAAGGALALLGVLPLLRLNLGVDPEVNQAATRIYLWRLSHHLNILEFKPEFLVRFAVFVAVWGATAAIVSLRDFRQSRLQAFCGASLLAVAVGIAVTLAAAPDIDRIAGLLRVYWYRLADAVIPLGWAFGAAGGLAQLLRWRPAMGKCGVALAIALAAWQLALVAPRVVEARPRADKPGKVTDLAGWREVCDWIRREAPREALFLTPRTCQTFKWYAERRELATWKDVPQDASGLVEWRRRLRAAFGNQRPCPGEGLWYGSGGEAPLDVLRAVVRYYGIDFVVTEAKYPIAGEEPVFAGEAYLVYDVRAWGTP